MTVLIRDSRIYERAFYGDERQFEAVAKRQLGQALSSFWVVDFKPLIVGDGGEQRRPDLAIVDRAYRSWVVVEVELSRHSLAHHVRPQVESLARANYHAAHAQSLASAAPPLDLKSLRDLLTFVPPDFMVVVDCQSVVEKGWLDLEHQLSVHLTFLETYRAANNDAVFVLSGFLPEVRPARIAVLRKHAMLNALVSQELAALPAVLAEFCAYSGERPLHWRITRTGTAAVLLPPGGVTIRGDRRYELLRADNGRFQLEVD